VKQSAGYIDRDGYRRYGRHGKSDIIAHVEIAERALGRRLPKGACVHHVDEDKLNNRNDNLVICPSNAYHKLLHVRMAARQACGNPDWRACTYCKQYSPLGELQTSFGKRIRFRHAACHATYQKKWRKA
jgi:hypothetical protein